MRRPGILVTVALASLIGLGQARAHADTTLYAQMGGDAHTSRASDSTSQAAGQFAVPGDARWTVDRVRIVGQPLAGAVEPASLTVRIYADRSGVPGKLIQSRPSTGIRFTASGSNPLGTTYTYAIAVAPVRLGAGTYWLSVAATCSTGQTTCFGWENGTAIARSTAYRSAGKWNPASPPTSLLFALEGTSSPSSDLAITLTTTAGTAGAVQTLATATNESRTTERVTLRYLIFYTPQGGTTRTRDLRRGRGLDSGATATWTRTFSKPGSYRVTFWGKDSSGKSSKTVSFTVS